MFRKATPLLVRQVVTRNRGGRFVASVALGRRGTISLVQPFSTTVHQARFKSTAAAATAVSQDDASSVAIGAQPPFTKILAANRGEIVSRFLYGKCCD